MRSRRALLAVAVAVLSAALLRVADANPAVAQTPHVPVWKAPAEPGLDGTSVLWRSVPAVVVPLNAQLTAPPMGGGSVQSVAVRALHWGERIFVALEWADSRPDAATDGVGLFADAAAVQFPAVGGTAVPAICMGQADQAVNIWHWRADSQEGVPDLPGHGYVDLYPSTDPLFYTAREAGNPIAEGATPVQNLVAGGFGTLVPGDGSVVEGRGVHGPTSWTVVFSRPLAATGTLEPHLGTGPIDAAFAVWDGALDQRNGIKSVSSFVQMRISEETHPSIRTAAGGLRLETGLASLIVGGLVALLAVGTVLAVRSGNGDEA